MKFENQVGKSHHFHVRRQNVYNALKWLVQHNPFYKDVNISSQNLDQLPEDGNIEDEITMIMEIPSDTQNDQIIEPDEQQTSKFNFRVSDKYFFSNRCTNITTIHVLQSSRSF